MHLTDPDQAVDFVEQTGVDALAVAIGTSHGAYKFTAKPTGDVLAMHLIEEIHPKLPETHMVMHGSSSVPQELVDRINAAGGKLEATYGVPVEEIQQGIRHGVRKVNVDTDGRLAITAALREALNANPSEFDPRAFFKPAREAQKQVVRRADDAVRRRRPRRRLHGALARRDGQALRREPRRCLSTTIDQLSINTIRTLTVDAVQAAQSGHPGAPLALAPAAYVLYTRVMKHNPADPHWPDRDRFVLSAGHASMLLYASLHLSGYDLVRSTRSSSSASSARTRRAIPRTSRRRASRRRPARSARASANARRDGDGGEVPARAASAPRSATTTSSRICSDGDLMEGVASEAASLAGHLRLGRSSSSTTTTRSRSTAAPTSRSRRRTCRSAFEAYGWHTLTVEDGNDLEAIEAAIRAGMAEERAPDADPPARR